MTPVIKTILTEYEVRKTAGQRRAFRQWLTPILQENGWAVREEKGAFGVRNLVIGDPDTAKVIYTAHYDTCVRLPFPNFITPKRPLLSVGYTFLIVIPVIALIFLVNWVLGMFVADPLVRYWISLVIYFAFLFILLGGPANKHTANDNTSGVITLLEIYEKLTEEQKKTVCLVFFDNEEQGLLGSAQFRKCYKKSIKETLMINFDCVSDGDTFLFGISKAANQKYHVALSLAYASTAEKQVLLENLKKIYYPSDQAGFPMAVAVAALKYKRPFGYYMDRIHTKRDTVFQEENIAYLAEHTVAFIDQI